MTGIKKSFILLFFWLILSLLTGCSRIDPMIFAGTPVVLVGAGDISLPGQDGDERTLVLLERVIEEHPDAVIFTIGDNTQGEGTGEEFTNFFDASWGRFKARIRPVPGNHDYVIDQGGPYYDYFGAAAGERGKGYYSYDLGQWHIVALNSNCDVIDCGPQSEQVRWLREDLQKSQDSGTKCTLLYWHHAHWSRDGRSGDSASSTFWEIAQAYRAEVVLNGHHHVYERLAPQDVNHNPSSDGIRAFVVGTGGAGHHEIGDLPPNTEEVDNNTYGVIQFKLYPGQYQWNFIPVDGDSFDDEGSGKCR